MLWARNNPDRIKEIKRRYREKNREAIAQYVREFKQRDPERVRAHKKKWSSSNPIANSMQKVRKRIKAEGISEDYRHATASEYAKVLTCQGGGCAICGVTKANRAGHLLMVDHNHATGQLRGLLCNSCNSAIGYLDEDLARIQRAIAYLTAHTHHAELPWQDRVAAVLNMLSE